MYSPLESVFQSVDGPAWSAGAELASILLFARANTLWRARGMQTTPLAMLLIRSLVALFALCGVTWAMGYPLPGFGSWNVLEGLTVWLGMFGGLGLLLFATSLSQLPSRLVFFGGSVHLFFGAMIGYFALGENMGVIRTLVTLTLGNRLSAHLYSSAGTRCVEHLAVDRIWRFYHPRGRILDPGSTAMEGAEIQGKHPIYGGAGPAQHHGSRLFSPLHFLGWGPPA